MCSMQLRSHWLFPLGSALMGKQIWEISLILETRTKSVPLFIAVMSHFIRMRWFHAKHLIHVAKMIHKLIKPDWLLLGGRENERGRERCRERECEGLYSEQSLDN